MTRVLLMVVICVVDRGLADIVKSDPGRECMQTCAKEHLETLHSLQAMNNYGFRIEHLPAICARYIKASRCARACEHTREGDAYYRIRYDMDYPCAPDNYEQFSTRLTCMSKGARRYHPCMAECRSRHEHVQPPKGKQCALTQCANECVAPEVLSTCNNDRIAATMFQEWMRQILRQQNLHLHLTHADLLSANISSQCQWALDKVALMSVSKGATTNHVLSPSRQTMLVYVWAMLTLAYTLL